MMRRLALACGALLLAAGLWQPVVGARFDPTTDAQLVANRSSCQGSGAVGYVLQLTAANTVGCAVASAAGPPAPAFDTASTTLTSSDSQRDRFPTNAITLTMANGGTTWRTGVVKNANTVTGLVTLAVPSGATLDGVTNGTTILFPYQRARILQTGSTAYVTDWVDRVPLLVDGSGAGNVSTAVASADFNLPAGYTKARVEITNLKLSANAYFGVRFSDSGSSGIKSGANDYYTNRFYSSTNGNAGDQAFTDTYGYLIANALANTSIGYQSKFVLSPGNGTLYPSILGESFFVDANGPRNITSQSIDYTGSTSGTIGRANLLRLVTSAGAFTGNVSIWGEP